MNLASCLEFILSYSVVFEEQCRRAFPYITLWGSIPSLSLPPPRQLPLIDQHTTLHNTLHNTLHLAQYITSFFAVFRLQIDETFDLKGGKKVESANDAFFTYPIAE